MIDIINAVQPWLPIVAFMLPLLVGLITKSTLSTPIKTAVMLILTCLATLLSQAEANAGLLTVDMLTTWIGATVVTIASYYGVWKNIPVLNSNAGNIAPNFGLGSSATPLFDDTEYEGTNVGGHVMVITDEEL